MKNNSEMFKDLQKLIDNTENGIYEWDYEGNLNGKVYYVKIIVKNATLYELSYFLKELDDWKVMYRLKDYEILIEKSKGE